MTEQFANFSQSTLSAAITATQTIINVASATSFPALGNFRIVVQSFDSTTQVATSAPEIMLVTAVAGNAFTVQRGAENSIARAYASGAQVTHIVTAGVMQALSGASSVVINTSLTGAGTTLSPLGINLAHANTWTTPQSIITTTQPQFVLGYDGSHFANFSVDSNGVLTVDNPDISGGQGVHFVDDVFIGSGGAFGGYNFTVGGNAYVSNGITSGAGFFGDGSGLTNLNLSGYGLATESYVSTYVSNALNFYVTSSDLSTALSNYVTSTALTSTLTGYVQASTITGYPNSLGGSSGDLQYNSGSGGLAGSSSLHWDGSSLSCSGNFYNNGNAGFGTSSPSGKLDVSTSSGTGIYISEAGSNSPAFNVYSAGTGFLYFFPKAEYTIFESSSSSNSTLQVENNGGYSRLRLTGSSDNRIDTTAGDLTLSPAGKVSVTTYVDSPSYYAGGTAPVADGTYTTGLGLTTNGSITTKGGIITAVTQAV